MDETLASVAIDFSGRAHCVCQWRFTARQVGDLQTELVEDFFRGFAQAAAANVHLRLLYGRSSHHQVEAIFKAFARALAVCRDARSAAEARAAQHQGAVMSGAMKISLVEYDAGNLPSVERALARQGIETERAATPEAVRRGRDVLMLPGVGHFGQLMRTLGARGLLRSDRARRLPAARRCWASAWGCRRFSRPAPKRRTMPA